MNAPYPFDCRTRTMAACLDSALSEPIFPPVAMPDNIDDPEAFPEIAEARAHARQLASRERCAELENRP